MRKNPYVLAIAGGTCSGKSTLANMLFETFDKEYKVRVFNMDKYFKKNPPKVIAPITKTEYVEHNHPMTMELDKLKDDFRNALERDWDIIIIEGLFALHIDEFREEANLKVYVDLKSDARLVRRIKKHMSWGQTYEQVTDRYIDTVRFRHDEFIEPTRWHADIVVNGTLGSNKGADVIIGYIDRQLKYRPK
jgi:uridine kinase